MKKFWCCILIVLAGCSLANFKNIREEYPPNLDAFEHGEQCPNLCWMNINPGFTTADDARQLLRASEEIDQKTFHRSETHIQVDWFFEKTRTLHSRVFVYLEDGLVKSIHLNNLKPFNLDDFVKILGNPNTIDISVSDTPDGGTITSYVIYYDKSKVAIWVLIGSNSGPDPNDYVKGMRINTEIDTQSGQPWIGYGQISKYLSVTDMPTTIDSTSPKP